MFTPDRSGTPEMMNELMKSLHEEVRQINFQPLALLTKIVRRANRKSGFARPMSVRHSTS